MAITFELVSKGSNHLVYLASSGGTTAAFDTGTIQATGVGDADVALEDAAVPDPGAYNAGQMKQIVDLATIVSDSMARRQLLDWGLSQVIGDGIVNVPGKRMRASITQVVLSGQEASKHWSIDASSDGTRGQYDVCCTATGTARALVRIEAIGTPQQF
jgi:hypothetical protein